MLSERWSFSNESKNNTYYHGLILCLLTFLDCCPAVTYYEEGRGKKKKTDFFLPRLVPLNCVILLFWRLHILTRKCTQVRLQMKTHDSTTGPDLVPTARGLCGKVGRSMILWVSWAKPTATGGGKWAVHSPPVSSFWFQSHRRLGAHTNGHVWTRPRGNKRLMP